MLGEKIRACRQQLHMSQQQLAEPDLSRSMICLIEKGRCNPSLETLHILAERLGKPVEYFLAGAEDNAELDGVRALLDGLSERPPADPEAALAQAVAAARMSQRLGNTDLEIKACMLQGESLLRARKYDQAVDRFEDCLDLCRSAGNKPAMVQAMYQAGRAAHFDEDLSTASRYYKRAARLAAGRKDLVDVHVRILINLGSCCLRLADGPCALQAYQEALTLAWSHGLEVGAKGQAFIGVALAYRQLRDSANAERTAVLAVQTLTSAKHPLLVVAKHNLAVILADQGRWAEAVPLFEDCLAQFERAEDTVQQVAVWEELARYRLSQGDLAGAERACSQALVLLDQRDDGILRGRVYRAFGQVARAQGRKERAMELFRTALEILRRLRASEEMAATQAAIAELVTPTTESEPA